MEKNHLLLILIAILIVMYLNWPCSSENFQSWPMDYESINYSPVAYQIDGGNNFYGTRGWINPSDAYNYANTIADDLDRPFASPMGSPTEVGNLTRFARLGGPRWDPSTWVDTQEPDGQFVGQIQSN
jgi:hypothetical protein